MSFDLPRALEVLARTPGVLESLLDGLSDTWLDANEGPDTFSPRDVVGHLIHGEETDWVPRIRIILEHGEQQPFTPFDRFGFRETIKGRSIDDLLGELRNLRGENLDYVRGLSLTAPDFESKGPASRAGLGNPRPAFRRLDGARPRPRSPDRPRSRPPVRRSGGSVEGIPGHSRKIMTEPRRLFCWFDTEYTTLELERARLLEVALIVTDDALLPLPAASKDIPEGLLRRDGFSAFLTPPPEAEISDHVKENYRPLLERCRMEGWSAEEVDDHLSSYMDSFPETRIASVRERPVLAGNSIYADYFLARKFLPRFLSHLNYRLFDVTTLKLEWLFHYREKKFEKLGGPESIRELYRGRDPIAGNKHDAYYDVQASITELAFYRSRLKKI